jgi:thiol-disulfide isomerase/thioredoxin
MHHPRLRLTALLMSLLLLLSGCAAVENASPTPTPTIESAAAETAAVANIDVTPAPWSTNGKGLPYLLFDTDDSPMTFSDLKGKVVYLNFFTSWCPPCKEELPDILKLQQTYGEELTVVLIHVPDRDTEDAAKQYLKDNGLDSLRMVEDKDFILTSRYQLEGYPLSVFIDKEGYLAAAQSGSLTYELMEQALQMAGIQTSETPKEE